MVQIPQVDLIIFQVVVDLAYQEEVVYQLHLQQELYYQGMGGRIATPSIGTIGQEPIRAYVLTGDISNGVQAGIALNNRRRLSGG